MVIHNTRHKRILYETDMLKSIRDNKEKGGRLWCTLNDKIKRLQKADGIVNTVRQAAARIASGADVTILKT